MSPNAISGWATFQSPLRPLEVVFDKPKNALGRGRRGGWKPARPPPYLEPREREWPSRNAERAHGFRYFRLAIAACAS
jgi:hypothetical protein